MQETYIVCFSSAVKKVFLEKKHVHLFQAGVLQSSLEVDLDHYKLSCSWRCHSPPNLPAALQYKKVTKINMVDVLYNTSLSKRCNQPKFSIVTNKISRWNEADFIHFHSASFETNKGKKIFLIWLIREVMLSMFDLFVTTRHYRIKRKSIIQTS